MTYLERAQALAQRHRFTMAIILTISIALLMTVISLSLYVSSGTLQLDLSRPGYESARKEIINPDDDSDFATTGPVNKRALDEYQKLFDAQRKELDSIAKFKGKGLEDESLGMGSGQPAPVAP